MAFFFSFRCCLFVCSPCACRPSRRSTVRRWEAASRSPSRAISATPVRIRDSLLAHRTLRFTHAHSRECVSVRAGAVTLAPPLTYICVQERLHMEYAFDERLQERARLWDCPKPNSLSFLGTAPSIATGLSSSKPLFGSYQPTPLQGRRHAEAAAHRRNSTRQRTHLHRPRAQSRAGRGNWYMSTATTYVLFIIYSQAEQAVIHFVVGLVNEAVNGDAYNRALEVAREILPKVRTIFFLFLHSTRFISLSPPGTDRSSYGENCYRRRHRRQSRPRAEGGGAVLCAGHSHEGPPGGPRCLQGEAYSKLHRRVNRPEIFPSFFLFSMTETGNERCV